MTLRACVYGVAAVLSLCACENREQQPEGALPADTLIATAPRRLPPVVTRIEGITLEVQDTIAAGKWDAAERMTKYLRDAQDSLRAVGAPLRAVANFATNVSELKEAIARRNALDANFAANRAARAVMVMSQAFASAVPPAVGLMAVDARDLLYMAEREDWGNANETVDALVERYGEIEAHVRQADPRLDAQVRREFEALASAVASRNAEEVQAVAQRVLQHAVQVGRTYGV